MGSTRPNRPSRSRRFAAALALAVWGTQLRHAHAQETSPSGPTFPGIAWNCSGWHKVVSGDLCWQIWQTYGITEAQFLEWNPDVTSGCASNFWPDYSYCVRVGAPGPTFPNIASNCDKWHTVVSGDFCWQIWQTYGITETQFLEWNPDVTSGCASNFWPDYSYCVGVNEDIGNPPESSSVLPSSTPASSTSSSAESSSINTSTTPYSIRHTVTSYSLTAPYTATALPPQHTLGGQPTYCNTWHQVAAGQTCEDIVNAYSKRLTLAQLLEYNPTIGEDCDGMYVGWYICVGIQPRSSSRIEWYTSQTNFTEPASTPYPGYVATAVANFTAVPQQTGIPSSCQNYYQAKDGDTCASVLSLYDYISEAQFFAWNPALDGNCQGLWLGYYYCVANFGPADLPMPPTLTTPGSPAATGTISTCQKWYKTRVNDDCAAIATWFSTFSTQDFITWNPSVGSACANIKQDTYYCVGIPGTPTTRSVTLTPTVLPTRPTQAGLVSGCTRFWLVSRTDTCASIIQGSGLVTVANATDFYTWNPTVGSNCAGLQPDYYVCVSITEWETIPPRSTVTISNGQTVGPPASSTPIPSSTLVSSTSSTPPVSTPVTTPTPYMPGMVAGCVRFYFRGSGPDDLYCYDIAMYAGIALSDFYTWNPQVGNDCSGLWADTWYCIGLQGVAPTTISSGHPTPAATP